MATSLTSQNSPYVDKLFVDTQSNNTIIDNILSGGATSYIIDIDNSNNGSAVYTKFWNNVNASIGTTEPNMIIKAPNNVRQVVTISEGFYFGSALSSATVTGKDTASTNSPTNDVTLRIMAE